VYDEIDLHRLTVDEALVKLDKFLHDAYVSGLYTVSVVHGKGTGILREAVRRELARHTLVHSFRPGGSGEGGASGVTIVRLTSK